MIERLIQLWFNITNGRPMRYLDFAFTDVVSGKMVNYYTDYKNRTFMAETKWGMFRVRVERSENKNEIE